MSTTGHFTSYTPIVQRKSGFVGSEECLTSWENGQRCARVERNSVTVQRCNFSESVACYFDVLFVWFRGNNSGNISVFPLF